MTYPAGAYGTVLAEAWEIRAGDELDGHPVKAATRSGTSMTVTFTDDTAPRSLGATDEVTLNRWFALPAPAAHDET